MSEFIYQELFRHGEDTATYRKLTGDFVGSGVRGVGVEIVAYPELGMEAIYRIEVEDFPAFIITDGKGSDFIQGSAQGIAR